SGLYSLYYEAEKGARSNFTLLDSPITSGGKYIASTQINRGYVTFDVYAPTTGSYLMWARALAPSATTSSFQVQVDTQTPILFDTSGGVYSSLWHWSRLNSGASPRLLTMTAGWHKLYVLSRDAPFSIDGFLITSDPALTPTDAAFTTLR
ncbi:MAG: hypothetical protein SGI92_32210, partial [Bryobacteraceae bacterium]|nr:hypothetical protein [Bryobacteraceae bacterium]